ncbi:MAG TPA: UDP-N-acetylmuramoyl-tripeptide--D-alanyl-D-alanine ligase, partial [Actinobacteria bacterium]|nr:UDP-N-acetylmuramoyl-tripeptide--D-alanyl-D-alanine ligase [Actinomycetes bacterium]HEX21350.1 UDP-N-acetylmuramoyl-tripeptide--D-alanyl-D-alanine ligase [Actinomycetota bacterium]
MISLKALEILDETGGKLVYGNQFITVNDVSVDSRAIRPGGLFVPLKGDKFDGHDFISQALAREAAGFITEKWDSKLRALISEFEDIFVIKVDDSMAALQKLAAGVRRRLPATVIGITGSTGKTCAKNFLESILIECMPVMASPKNYNNEIGVPLTIFMATEQTEALIIEMGMRGPNQIRDLCEIANPRIGLITNIGDTHIGRLGSRKSIAGAKGELLQTLPADGVAVLNADDDWISYLTSITKAKIITFGLSADAQVRAQDIYLDNEAKAHFEVVIPGEKFTVKLAVPGKHSVYNALAATAVSVSLGVDTGNIKAGLAKAKVADMRLTVSTNSRGVTIINDTYNANPASVKAALETMAAYKVGGRRVAVLGDMAELGEVSKQAHHDLG